LEDRAWRRFYLSFMLGEELRKARVGAGLTQEELAFRADISRNYVSLLELDRKSPTLAVLDRVCEVLGVRTSVIIARRERRERR
jgi:transcriptional regulator with XRE-family HTH domain